MKKGRSNTWKPSFERGRVGGQRGDEGVNKWEWGGWVAIFHKFVRIATAQHQPPPPSPSLPTHAILLLSVTSKNAGYIFEQLSIYI